MYIYIYIYAYIIHNTNTSIMTSYNMETDSGDNTGINVDAGIDVDHLPHNAGETLITYNINKLSINCNTNQYCIQSYGILCVSKVKSVLKVLLISISVAYGLFNLTTCNYSFNKHGLINMLNKMTVDGKCLMMRCHFDALWNKLRYEVNSFNNISYHKTKQLYDEYITNCVATFKFEGNIDLITPNTFVEFASDETNRLCTDAVSFVMSPNI